MRAVLDTNVVMSAIFDPDDDAIIACALGGKAKIICSGDDDLLSLNGFRGLEILKPREFKTRYLV